MIFVINELKYDTNKMELISEKCEYYWDDSIFGSSIRYRGRNVKLWRSKKNNWLLTFEKDLAVVCGRALTSEEAKEILLKCDLNAYEKIFGELEEA